MELTDHSFLIMLEIVKKIIQALVILYIIYALCI
jgi:hypothetical protein